MWKKKLAKKQKSYGSYEKKKDAEKHLIEIKST
ncbi:Arm DNA-binding domain-containing protein, partial